MNSVIYFLGIFSAFYAFIFSFPFYTNSLFLLITCLSFCFIQYIIEKYIQDKKRFYQFSIILSIILLILSFDGLLYIKDIILQKYMNVSVYTFNLSHTINYYDDFMTIMLAMASFMIPINTLNIYLYSNKKYILSAIILFPFIFVEILFTITPPLYATPYILYCLIMVLSKRQVKIQILPICLSLCFMLSIFYIVPPSSYFHPRENRLYGQNSTRSAPTQEDDIYNLMEQGNRYYSNSVDLVIKGITNHSFKLRGMVYNHFDGTWYQTTAKRSYQYTYTNRIQKLGTHLNCSQQKITVIDNYHNNIVYTPYFYTSSSDTLKYFTSHYEGKKEEEFDIIIPNQKWNEYLKLSDFNKAQYNLDNLDFAELSYQYDSQSDLIPDDTKEILWQFIKKHKLDQFNDVQDLINKTKKALFKDTQYSLTPGVTPNNENFFDYFLNKNKKGYCVHYASTLALILKLNDFPANFVTGYQVDSQYSKDGYTNVLDSSSHAWVEIDDPILGVIPIEASPAAQVTQNHEDDPLQPSTTPESDDNDVNLENNDSPVNDDTENHEFKIPVYIYPLCFIFTILLIIYIQSRIRYKRQFKNLTVNQSVCKMYYHLSKSNINISQEIMLVIKKAKFSNHELTWEEYQKVTSFYNQSLHDQSTIIKKIKLKYIYAYI